MSAEPRTTELYLLFQSIPSFFDIAENVMVPNIIDRTMEVPLDECFEVIHNNDEDFFSIHVREIEVIDAET